MEILNCKVKLCSYLSETKNRIYDSKSVKLESKYRLLNVHAWRIMKSIDSKLLIVISKVYRIKFFTSNTFSDFVSTQVVC